jgi:phage shock protein PspC (stress-responsive transcriptional regulator)
MKHLYRSRSKVLGGVCGGLAEYLEIDPVVVRLITAIALFFTCCSILPVYLIAWLIMPERPVGAE